MPPIAFNDIPSTARVPRHFVEFDATRAAAASALQPYRVLLIGQRTSAGTVAELVPTQIASESQAREYFGVGSMLHGMATKFFANNRETEVWAVAQDDDGAGVAAESTITFVGTASAAGAIYLYVAGVRLVVAVANTDAAATVATAVAAAITAEPTLPVTASASTAVVTIVAKNAGLEGEDIDIRLNHGAGETLPAGITGATIASSVTGANNPDLSAVWAVLGETHYTVLGVGYADQTNLTELDRELADRWGPLRMIDGVAFVAAYGSQSTLTSLGNANNSKHVSILGMNGALSTSWELAAAVAGVVAREAQEDPARPFQTLELAGIVAPNETDRFDYAERAILLTDGIATYDVSDPGGTVRIERLVTTSQLDENGSPTTVFLDVNTPLTLSFFRYDLRRRFQAKYPRHKLADNGARFGAGQPVVTPNVARGECLAAFRDWEERGLAENFEQFKADLVVERSDTDPNRLEMRLAPDLVNQLRVIATQIQFLL